MLCLWAKIMNVVRTLFYLILEIFAISIYIISGIFGYFWRQQPIRRKKPPVVIIHGWLTRGAMLFTQKFILEKEGYEVHVPEFGWQLEDIENLSEKLNSYIEKEKLNNVILIGNSLGAIISLHYLKKYNGWKRVKKLISVAGPFGGSPLAYLAMWFSKSAKQMTLNSQFLKQLTQNITHKNKITCVSAEIDFLVPKSSSQIKGAKNKIIKILGHVNLQLLFPLYFKEIF